MRIEDSARRRQHSDADMHHAIRHAVTTFQRGDVTMFLGTDRDGRFLEVRVRDLDTDAPRVIHCMNMRKGFRKLLPKLKPRSQDLPRSDQANE